MKGWVGLWRALCPTNARLPKGRGCTPAWGLPRKAGYLGDISRHPSSFPGVFDRTNTHPMPVLHHRQEVATVFS